MSSPVAQKSSSTDTGISSRTTSAMRARKNSFRSAIHSGELTVKWTSAAVIIESSEVDFTHRFSRLTELLRRYMFPDTPNNLSCWLTRQDPAGFAQLTPRKNLTRSLHELAAEASMFA